MRLWPVPLILIACSACRVATQPPSTETVAAFEVPLPTAKDRAAFVAILRDAAKVEGGHVDVASEAELRTTGEMMPLAKMSIHAGVWGDSDDKDSWAIIMDQHDHIGQVWIMFSKAEDEESASRFRKRAMQNIGARWDVISLPIIVRRSIPLRRDLVRTPAGYRLNPSAALRYVNDPST